MQLLLGSTPIHASHKTEGGTKSKNRGYTMLIYPLIFFRVGPYWTNLNVVKRAVKWHKLKDTETLAASVSDAIYKAPVSYLENTIQHCIILITAWIKFLFCILFFSDYLKMSKLTLKALFISFGIWFILIGQVYQFIF